MLDWIIASFILKQKALLIPWTLYGRLKFLRGQFICIREQKLWDATCNKLEEGVFCSHIFLMDSQRFVRNKKDVSFHPLFWTYPSQTLINPTQELLCLILLFLKFKFIYILCALTWHLNTSGSCRCWFSCVCSEYVVVLHLETPRDCKRPPTSHMYFTRSQKLHNWIKPTFNEFMAGDQLSLIDVFKRPYAFLPASLHTFQNVT